MNLNRFLYTFIIFLLNYICRSTFCLLNFSNSLHKNIFFLNNSMFLNENLDDLFAKSSIYIFDLENSENIELIQLYIKKSE